LRAPRVPALSGEFATPFGRFLAMLAAWPRAGVLSWVAEGSGSAMNTLTWSQVWSRSKALWQAWQGWPVARALCRAGLAVLIFVTPLRKWLVDILVVAIGVVFVVSAFLELQNTVPVMDPISVPKSLVERGYSGDVMAARLIDSARDIERETNASTKRNSTAATERFTPALDVTVPGSGVSMAVVVETVKRLFGRQAQRIGGEILIDGSGASPSYRMTVRVSKPPWAFTTQDNASIDAVIRSSAEQLTGVMRPCAFAALLLDHGGTRADIDRLIETCARSGDDREWAHNLRGLRFAEQGQFDVAIEQYKKALDLFPTYENARENLAAASRAERPTFRPAAGSLPPR
jgi:hypothetical protein